MKVSLNWIKEFTDVNLSVDDLVEKIGAQLGAVEEVIDVGEKYKGIVIAKVISCRQHPNADKLKVCAIDDGGNTPDVKRNDNGHVEVVCGAPNAREGLLVAWLPPGTTVPSTADKDPLKLEARDIRGVISNGMLASAYELALSGDHSGIVELSFGEIGGDFAEEFGLNDCIIDIENKMFTHRPDCFGILGVAREIAGITGQQFKSPEWYQEETNSLAPESSLGLDVDNKISKLVPRFMGQVIEGVEVKPSPVWMQAYLSRVGIRPINNIVDVTNYAMYLTAQPLHAYDYDKLCKVAGTKSAQLETRLSKKSDRLKLLNGKELVIEDDETILICTGDTPVGVGGVMGGADTEVDENTKNIVLECANFDMYAIRRASMRHGLFTDAVTRFNKGQSYLQNPAVLQKSVGWMTQLAGGKFGKIIDTHQALERPSIVHVTKEFINERLGLNLDNKDIAVLLTNTEFKMETSDEKLTITAPFWRTDIEIPEDIVEEVGRLYGYDKLLLELPIRDLTPAKKDKMIEVKKSIREVLSAAGANEVLTYSFVHGNLLEKAGQKPEDSYQLSNALSPDLQYYRQSLTPSLLDKIHPNIKAGYDEFAIFEINKSHNKIHGLDDEKVPGELEMVALTYASKQTKGQVAYYQARKYLDLLMHKFGLTLSYQPIGEDPGFPVTAPFDYMRSAMVSTRENNVYIGIVGEYRPEVTNKFKIPSSTAGFEIGTEHLLEAIQKLDSSRYVSLSKFPKVDQDISLKAPLQVTYGELFDFISQKVEELKPANTLAKLEPIDIFQRSEDVEHKQVTLRLTISSFDRTLTSEEVNALLDRAADTTQEKFGAERI